MSVLLVCLGLFGLLAILWYSNEHVNSGETWVYQVIAACWAVGCLIFAGKAYFA